MPYTKFIEQKIGDHDVKCEIEFNTEDIGLSITTTVETEFFKEFEAKVKESFDKDFPKIKEFLTKGMGKEGYEEYMRLYKESLADYASWAKEINNKSKVIAKVKYFEDGRCKTFINGRPKENSKLSKNIAEKTIRALRSSAIHGEMPKDLR